MTVKELIHYLHCSENTAYKLIQAKTFPSLKIFNKWYIDKGKLSSWIDKHEKKLEYAK
jgi:excisionase family DNA binding protein